MELEHDLNSISREINELEEARQESLKVIEELRTNFKNIDLNTENIEEYEKVNKENAKILRKIKKEQKICDNIFETQIELSILKNKMIEDVISLNDKLASLKTEVRQLDRFLLNVSSISNSNEAKIVITELKEAKEKEIKELEYRKSLYFDKNLKKDEKEEIATEEKIVEPVIQEENIPVIEESSEPIKQQENVLDDLAKEINEERENAVNAKEEPEAKEISAEVTEENNDKEPVVKDDIVKKPIAIRNLDNWCAKNKSVLQKGAVIVATAVAVLLTGGMTAGALSALGVTVGEVVSTYVAGKAVFGKGK